MPHATDTRDRLLTLDALRGLAALAVCWFHFVVTLQVATHFAWVNRVSEYGKHGVEVFFVISGFVIPLAMSLGGYRLPMFGRFLAKRMLRLYPPYVASLVLVLGLQWASGFVPGYGGERFAVRPVVWLQHLTYTTGVFQQSWLTPVYWTLAIEFQFYLLIGLAFPLLNHRRAAVRTAAMLAFAAAPCAMVTLVPPGPNRFDPLNWLPWLPWWLAAFLPGVAAFHHRRGTINTPALLGWVAVAAAAQWFSHGKASAAASALTTLVIAFVRVEWRPLLWLGTISYSLYLVHMPLGGKLVSLGGRYVTGPVAAFGLVAAALAASLAAAGFMYWLVEKPSERWSKATKYRRRSAAAPTGEPADRQEPPLVTTAVP